MEPGKAQAAASTEDEWGMGDPVSYLPRDPTRIVELIVQPRIRSITGYSSDLYLMGKS